MPDRPPSPAVDPRDRRVDLPRSWKARLDPVQRYGVRLTLIGLAIVLVTVPFSALMFDVLAEGFLTRVDASVANAMNEAVHGHPWAVDVLLGISWLGRPPVLAVLVIPAVVYPLPHRRPRLAVFLVVVPVGGGIVDTLVKIAVDRPRPVVDHPVTTAIGKSFPSGHAMSSTVTFGALLLVFLPVVAPRWRRVAVAVTFALVLAICASRLLLGVHFVTDVVGGFVLGVAWLAGGTAAFEAWRVDRGRQPSHPLEEGVEPEAREDLKLQAR